MQPATIKRKLNAILLDEGGDKTEAARWLSMAPKRFRRLLEQPSRATSEEQIRISDLFKAITADHDSSMPSPNEGADDVPPQTLDGNKHAHQDPE